MKITTQEEIRKILQSKFEKSDIEMEALAERTVEEINELTDEYVNLIGTKNDEDEEEQKQIYNTIFASLHTLYCTKIIRDVKPYDTKVDPADPRYAENPEGDFSGASDTLTDFGDR